MAFLSKLKAGLKKTRDKFSSGMKSILTIGRKLDEDLLDEIEEKLMTSDMGPTTALALMEALTKAYKAKEIKDAEEVMPFLRKELLEMVGASDSDAAGPGVNLQPSGPTVVLVVGVNGAGKTTSIAKLANHFHAQGKKVILGAGDTFRAAAVEQLTVWAERIGIEIIKHGQNADPAAVAFDAASSAVSRGTDVLIVDTAGRLHTQRGLMEELRKIDRVVGRIIPGAPHQRLLVVDATAGQNVIQQAREFGEALPLTGIVLSKFDSSARGGTAVAVARDFHVPVTWLGTGERAEDLEPFDANAYVEKLLG